jgi:hypothetical protein
MKYPKILLIGSLMAFGINLMVAGSVLGQSNQSSVNVTRSGSLSFGTIPTRYNFGTITVPSKRTPTFTNSTVDVWNGGIISVQDTRGTGGFTVTISANGNFSDGGSNTILVSNTAPNDNLRIVTAPPDFSIGTTQNGVSYGNGFSGPMTVSAPINVAMHGGNTFGQESTFLGVTNNVLDTDVPVVVFDGTLSSTVDGRVGLMETGSAGMLYIPAYQAPGRYSTTLTWTLTDSTT